MAIRISRTLKAKLPESERADIDQQLWDRSGGICALCEQAMNRAADTLEADHIVAEAENGLTELSNLQLVHQACNRIKKNHPAVEVRPYLKLRALFEEKSGVLRFDEFMASQNITPAPCFVRRTDSQVELELDDGSIVAAPIMRDGRPGGGTWDYAYISVPPSALFNDLECQPRGLKQAQVWAIYTDLHLNPLHEPPSCRVAMASNGEARLLMFDGQHKSVASVMRGADRLTVKVYLDLTQDEAVRLVNSIQAKIKKLPLSPFELTAKMADEMEAQVAIYAAEVGDDAASEKGFIDWLPAGGRKRGKDAFEAALTDEILEEPDLEILRFVQRSGQAKNPDSLMTEAAFKGKVLNTLMHRKPLMEAGDTGQRMRGHERHNIVAGLNMLCELAFDPQDGQSDLSDLQAERRRRMTYQASLAYVASLIRQAYAHILSVAEDKALLEKTPTDDDLSKIHAAIERIVEHPVWVADLSDGPKMKAIDDALQKNQDAKAAFESVGLKLGYVVGADKLPTDWKD